jgi:hypothetical protein
VCLVFAIKIFLGIVICWTYKHVSINVPDLETGYRFNFHVLCICMLLNIIFIFCWEWSSFDVLQITVIQNWFTFAKFAVDLIIDEKRGVMNTNMFLLLSRHINCDTSVKDGPVIVIFQYWLLLRNTKISPIALIFAAAVELELASYTLIDLSSLQKLNYNPNCQ